MANNMDQYILHVDAEVSRAVSKLDKIRNLMGNIERLRNKGVDDYYTTNQKDMDKNMRSMKQLTYMYRQMSDELDNIQKMIGDTTDSIVIPDNASSQMKSQLNDMKSSMDQYVNDVQRQQAELRSSYLHTLQVFREMSSFQQNYSKNFKHLFSSNDVYNLPNKDKSGMSQEEAARATADELERARNVVISMASDVDDVTDRFDGVIAKIKEVNKLERRTESMSRRASASNYMSYQQAQSFIKDRGTVEVDYKEAREDNFNKMIEIGRERTRLHEQIKEIENNPTATQDDIDRKIAYQQEIQAMDKEVEARVELNRAIERTIKNMQKYNEAVQGIEVKPKRGSFSGMIYERAPAIGLALGGAMGATVGGLYHRGSSINKGLRDDEITIGQRTDTSGDQWRDGIRNAAINAGLQNKLGFSGQEMMTFQNSYLSRHGFTNMDDLETARDNQAVFSRVSGVNAADTNQLFSTIFGTGAVSGNQVKDIQNAFLGAIKQSGMEGREKEQLQALDGILQGITKGREATNQEVMNVLGLQSVLSSSGTRALQGESGGELLANLHQGIKQGFNNPMVRLAFGQGSQYQGLEGRWALRQQMGKGISDVENVNTIARFSQQMGGGNKAIENEAFMSFVQEALGVDISSQQGAGMMDLFRSGQLTQENIDSMLGSNSADGAALADKRLAEYQESSAATDNQSDATLDKHAARLYDYGEVLRDANIVFGKLPTPMYTLAAAIAALTAAMAGSAAMFGMSTLVRKGAAKTMTQTGVNQGPLGGIFGGKGGGGKPPTPPTGGYTQTPGGIWVPGGSTATGGGAGGSRAYGGWRQTVGGWFNKGGGLYNPGPSTIPTAAAEGAAGASGLSKFLSGAGKVLQKAALPLAIGAGVVNVATAEEGTKGKAVGESAGGILGGMAAGAGTGALLGTMGAGPIGTAVGGILGGIAGAFAGSGIGGWVGGLFDPKKASAAEMPTENKTEQMTDKETANTKERTETKRVDNLQYERENLHIHERLLDRTAQLLSQARAQGGIFGQNGGVGGDGTYTGGGAPSVSGSTNAEKIWNFFSGKGMSSGAIAGIMGNLQQESGLNPNAQNPNGAFGIAQWMGGRKTGLQKYAQSNGLEANSLEAQLGWLWEELQNGQNGNVKDMQGMNARQAADYFEKKFERSGGSAMGKRRSYAEDFYSQYGSNAQWTPNSGASAKASTNVVRVDSKITVDVRGDESVADKIKNNKDMQSAAQNIQQMIYGSMNHYSKEMRMV
jgi:hypothetical protein